MDSNTPETVFQPIDRTEAERLTTRIRLRLDAIADNYVAVMPLIREAIERQAWSVLGYSGVSEYVSECFGDALTQLGVEVRREVVRELTAAGLSTRAIAPVVGTSRETVRRDLSGDTHVSPETEGLEPRADPSFGADLPMAKEPFICGNYCWHSPVCPPASSATSSPKEDKIAEEDLSEVEFVEAIGAVEPAEFDNAIAAAKADADLSRTNVLAHAVEQGSVERPDRPDRSTGLDGKSYPRRPKPRRPSLPDSYFRAAHDLSRKTDTVARLVEDDRYATNKTAVTERSGADMLRALSAMANAVSQLDAECLAADERGRNWWQTELDEIAKKLDAFGAAVRRGA